MRNVAFTRWDPLRDLLALHEQIGHLAGTDAPGWTPPVDLYETPIDFVLTAELPGLTRDQIEIHAEEGRIVIRGARVAGPDRAIPCEQYHRVDRRHGRFPRSLLPSRGSRPEHPCRPPLRGRILRESPARRYAASQTSRRCRSSARATRRSPTIHSSGTSSATMTRSARAIVARSVSVPASS